MSRAVALSAFAALTDRMAELAEQQDFDTLEPLLADYARQSAALQAPDTAPQPGDAELLQTILANHVRLAEHVAPRLGQLCKLLREQHLEKKLGDTYRATS